VLISHSIRILIVYQPWVLDEEPSIEIMKAAWDLGINTIDTANIYSNGESERLIATFINKV
jgi:aryl-alcohol dehydrogenase-like predicted oxidoreductase